MMRWEAAPNNQEAVYIYILFIIHIWGISWVFSVSGVYQLVEHMKEIARSQMAQVFTPARSWAAIEAPVLQLFSYPSHPWDERYITRHLQKNQPHVGRYTMHGSYGYGLVGI